MFLEAITYCIHKDNYVYKYSASDKFTLSLLMKFSKYKSLHIWYTSLQCCICYRHICPVCTNCAYINSNCFPWNYLNIASCLDNLVNHYMHYPFIYERNCTTAMSYYKSMIRCNSVNYFISWGSWNSTLDKTTNI